MNAIAARDKVGGCQEGSAEANRQGGKEAQCVFVLRY